MTPCPGAAGSGTKRASKRGAGETWRRQSSPIVWLTSALGRGTGQTSFSASDTPMTSQPPRELANEATILGTLRRTLGEKDCLNSRAKPSS